MAIGSNFSNVIDIDFNWGCICMKYLLFGLILMCSGCAGEGCSVDNSCPVYSCTLHCPERS